MSDKEFEVANLLLPIQNTSRVTAQADKLATPTTQVMGLPTLFGNWSQHFYTVKADGGKVYVALSHSPTGTIDPGITSGATGVPTAVGWPLADQSTLHGTVLGGTQKGLTGPSATLFDRPQFLLYRTASGVGSAYIRVRRSSVGVNSGQEEFYPAGWKRGNR